MIPDPIALAIFVIVPFYATSVSRSKSFYYVAGAVLGVALSLLYAVWYLSPNDRVSRVAVLATAAMQGTALHLRSMWFDWVTPEMLFVYGVVSVGGSLVVLHHKLRDEPIEKGTATTEIVEALLVLAGSLVVFAADTQNIPVACGLVVIRIIGAWWMRPRSEHEIMVQRARTAQSAYADCVVLLEAAGLEVESLAKKTIKLKSRRLEE